MQFAVRSSNFGCTLLANYVLVTFTHSIRREVASFEKSTIAILGVSLQPAMSQALQQSSTLMGCS
jgi:hypothetical protein